ncbi:hypothetical protein, partial [Candidatus Agathobaculum pullicola]|uniref:hypothetical protein n=1 Tax=Candidatus Agathobaculum pullicola TaxID=2838426 RepID=UPI003F92A342
GGELGKQQSKEWYSQTAIPFFSVLAVFVLVIACSKSNIPIKLQTILISRVFVCHAAVNDWFYLN